MGSSHNAGPGRGRGVFSFQISLFKKIVVVILLYCSFSNVRHLSFIYGGNKSKNEEYTKATKGTFLFVFRN